MKDKPAINIVWLKRDLRLSDHEPLKYAMQSGVTLLYYVFEPMLVNDPHYDERHWRFVTQSIEAINAQLAPYHSRVFVYYGDAISGLNHIRQSFEISGIYSHEEVGLLSTYERDKSVSTWCKVHQIPWRETASGAVIRGVNNRLHWDNYWKSVMNGSLSEPYLSYEALANQQLIDNLPQSSLPLNWRTTDEFMLKGGEYWAHRTLQSFLHGRGKHYHFSIGKPLESRTSCSRLSPYLAWGNISLRQLYQAILAKQSERGWKKPLSALLARLHWHCHFIQKFESEHQMEWRPVNKAYSDFTYPIIHCGLSIEERLNSWKLGETGYPLVDACMKCLIKTGYINFRMRAMLVSFLCHHLLVDWRLGVKYLAQLFLDFEPGIHYPQFQMQSGVTGMNTIRVYNPVKQSIEKDNEGEFIKKWLPVLASLPKEIIHTPWELSPMEQQIYEFTLGQCYPKPMVDINETGAIARDILWRFRKRIDAKKENHRILARHVNKKTKRKRNPSLKNHLNQQGV